MALRIIPHGWVCVDLEFVGDITASYLDCRIWNIGAVKPDGTEFSIVMKVPTDRKTHAGCVHVTENFLKHNNAVTFAQGFRSFCDWVGPQAVIICHNCFKSDKPVLEAECKRHNVEMPCWYFFDSLLFLRTKIQCTSYRLGDVYNQVVGKGFRDSHVALDDARALWQILQKFRPDSLYMYPKYLTPLQNIRWVGSACEQRLVEQNVRSVEDLVLKYMQWVQVSGHTVTLVKQFLMQFNLPCHDLTPISKEIVDHWLPTTFGGLSKITLI